jgi:hypothetical protein
MQATARLGTATYLCLDCDGTWDVAGTDGASGPALPEINVSVMLRLNRIVQLSLDLTREMEREDALNAQASLHVAESIQTEIAAVIRDLNRPRSV